MDISDQSVREHYAELIELPAPWFIQRIIRSGEPARLDIHLAHPPNMRFACRACSARAPVHDHGALRSWRHVDACEQTIWLHAKLPRIRCSEHGVRTLQAPWAETNARFTRAFEARALRTLQAAASQSQAAKLLNIKWDQLATVRHRAVARGIARRDDAEPVRRAGIDEKSFAARHHYGTILSDLDAGRVIDVVEHRKQDDAQKMLRSLPESVRAGIVAAACDMWPAYANAIQRECPNAVIVHDKFHIVAHLKKAVDQVRRAENKRLLRAGDERLKGAKWLFLQGEKNMKPERLESFEQLKKSGLDAARAWAAAEVFIQRFWTRGSKEAAAVFARRWIAWAGRSKHAAIKKVAKMIKKHLARILTWFDHPITNAVAEGLNAKIQVIKSGARGYRNFESFRASILFHCGKLAMLP